MRTIYGCWVAGTIVGVLPLVSWNSPKLKENEWEWEICMFVQVVNHNFIKFIYVTTIIVPSIFIATAFIHIYFVSLKQIKNQIPEKSTTESNNAMQELFNSARKQDIKSTKILGLMVIIFMISWIPINTFNIIIIIKPHLKPPIILNNLFITISHLNSVINPVLYIYQFNNFKDALKSVLNSSKESQKKNNRDNIAHIYNSSNPIYMLKDKNMIQMLSLKVFESKSNSPDSSIASNLSTYISTHLENDEDKSVHQNNVESAKNNNEIKS
ncbi:adenosine receptor A1-like isoform X2 [Lycorma delicatula]|uniref:adenosine receptor A1-like isoform X2 n=1 Tax=Lycorma delicatula TaxID=130591 RepID=UPI003F50EC07